MKRYKYQKKVFFNKYIIFLAIILISLIIYSLSHINKDIFTSIYSINDSIDEEICESIKKIKNESNSNTVIINFITDIHMKDEENEIYLDNIKAFTNISNSGVVDLSISGGDLFYGSWKNRNEGKVNLKCAKLLFKDVKTPMLYTRGNHDCNIKTIPEEAISNEDYYKIMLKDLEGIVNFNPNDEFGGYYYKDLERQKIRVCILNAFNGENYQYIFGNTQLQFIADTVLNFEDKENPKEWQVVFFTHTIEPTIVHSESVEDKEKLYEIIEAYRNASTVEINNSIIDYSRQGKGTIIAIITGHHHLDFTYKQKDFPIIITRTASVIDDRDEPRYTIEEVYGTKNETSFDIFVINPDKRTIKTIKVGRGEDRSFNY